MQHNVASTHDALGDIVLWSKEGTSELVARAVADYERALEIQERLARENPAVLTYWQDLSGTLRTSRGSIASRAMPSAPSTGDAGKGAAWKNRLEHDPANDSVRAQWANKLEDQATLEGELGMHAESLATRLQVRDAWLPIQKRPAALPPHRAKIRA